MGRDGGDLQGVGRFLLLFEFHSSKGGGEEEEDGATSCVLGVRENVTELSHSICAFPATSQVERVSGLSSSFFAGVSNSLSCSFSSARVDSSRWPRAVSVPFPRVAPKKFNFRSNSQSAGVEAAPLLVPPWMPLQFFLHLFAKQVPQWSVLLVWSFSC